MQFLCLVSPVRLFGALSSWPFEWARGLLQHQAFAQRKAIALVEEPSADTVAGLADAVGVLQSSGVSAAFDLARAQHAAGVRAGLIECSILESGVFERRLGLLERMTMGPLARTV
jgi:hypothetical protein